MVSPFSDRISRVPPYSRTLVRITHTGLSPTMALLSRRFCLSHQCRWPGPRSLATTCGVSVDVLSYGYLDVSVPRVRFLSLCIQNKIPFNDTWKPVQLKKIRCKAPQGRTAVANRLAPRPEDRPEGPLIREDRTKQGSLN